MWKCYKESGGSCSNLLNEKPITRFAHRRKIF
jgi:hypothetical protein